MRLGGRPKTLCHRKPDSDTLKVHPAQGYLSTNYSDNYFFLSQRHPEVPRLTPAQLEAMKLFNQLAASDALRLEANLEPGDIQLLNNHVQVRDAADASTDGAVDCCGCPARLTLRQLL